MSLYENSPSQSFGTVLMTTEVDFTVNVTGVHFSPAAVKPGYYFVGNRYALFFKTLSGTFSGNLTVSWGNNANENNYVVATATTAASLNTVITTPGIPSALCGLAIGAPAAGNVMIDASTEITYKHTGATGVTVVGTGRALVFGAWVPV